MNNLSKSDYYELATKCISKFQQLTPIELITFSANYLMYQGIVTPVDIRANCFNVLKRYQEAQFKFNLIDVNSEKPNKFVTKFINEISMLMNELEGIAPIFYIYMEDDEKLEYANIDALELILDQLMPITITDDEQTCIDHITKILFEASSSKAIKTCTILSNSYIQKALVEDLIAILDSETKYGNRTDKYWGGQ